MNIFEQKINSWAYIDMAKEEWKEMEKEVFLFGGYTAFPISVQ